MTKLKTFTTIIEEANDGTGDGILTFPPEILEEMGWKEGTQLNIHEKDGNIYISEVKPK